MTSWVVADASVYLAAVFTEPLTTHADALIHHWTVADYQIAAPYLFRYEVVSVVRKHVARGLLSEEAGKSAVDGLLRQPIVLFADDTILRRAFALAGLHGRPNTYDMVYAATAEKLGCELWTADQRLVNAVSASLNWVKWLGAFPVS
jgi:predicted nucleic acid-binding protein